MNRIMSGIIFSLLLTVLPSFTLAASPATLNLGTAGNYVILAKTGISSTGSTSIIGNIGVSPAAATYITGFALTLPASSNFSTSAIVNGKVYSPSYADPTPSNLSVAVLDMQNAYTDAAGRASSVTELGAGNIGGLTLAPGVYKWGTGVTIPTNVTLSGSANDVWIFQIAQNLNISSATKIILAGGAQANNIFWVVAGQTTVGTTAVFNGNILDQTAIVLNTGAVLNGRALAQTAVTLDSNAVTIPTPVVTVQTQIPPVPQIPNPVMCTQEVMQCSDGSYVSRQSPTCAFASCPVVNSQTQVTISGSNSSNSNINSMMQDRLNQLKMTMQSLQTQVQMRQQSSATSGNSGNQQVKMMIHNLNKGSRGDDVTTLQQFLISQNKGPSAQALSQVGTSAYFGALTRAALSEFQMKMGITPPLGNFGPITRMYINTNY